MAFPPEALPAETVLGPQPASVSSSAAALRTMAMIFSWMILLFFLSVVDILPYIDAPGAKQGE